MPPTHQLLPPGLNRLHGASGLIRIHAYCFAPLLAEGWWTWAAERTKHRVDKQQYKEQSRDDLPPNLQIEREALIEHQLNQSLS